MISNDVIFRQRPSSVPFGYRVSCKITLICLCMGLNTSKRASSSMIKLQLIINNLLYNKNLDELIAAINTKSFIYNPIRFDPSINKALLYAEKDGLIERLANKNYKLTKLGWLFFDKLIENQIFKKEVLELKKLGIANDSDLDIITRKWKYNDEN